MIWTAILALAAGFGTALVSWSMQRSARERRHRREFAKLAELIREEPPVPPTTPSVLVTGFVSANEIRAGRVTLSGEPREWPLYAMHDHGGVDDDAETIMIATMSGHRFRVQHPDHRESDR